MGRRLYVGNLPYTTGEAELQELFSKAGTVESVRVMRDAIAFRPVFHRIPMLPHYQRGSRRPPPPPPPPRLPPNPPPPPPKPPSGLGRASLTVSARPPIWN